MNATARRTSPDSLIHRVEMRHHHLTVDEPDTLGGDDEGPSPQELLAASLAACTSITMQMYAQRKGWELGELEVQVDSDAAPQDGVTRFSLRLRLPSDCTEEQVERLRAIAARCPVHRVLQGEVEFEDRVELVDAAGR